MKSEALGPSHLPVNKERRFEMGAATAIREKMVNVLNETKEDYILIMNDEDNEPEVRYYTDIVTMAQSAKLLLGIVKSMLDDSTDEEKELVATVLGMQTE